jgi:putative PEP-CTERM system TPR-repeat lipoprotein
MGETERALTHLNAALAADPHDVRALFVLGVLHARNGDFRAADEALTRAAKRKPNDPRIRAAVGRTMLARGLVEPGLRELHAAAQLDTGSVDHDTEIIMFHMRRNEPEAALKVAAEMARKQPKSATPDQVRGRIRQAMGDIDGATKAYESAVAKDPRYFPATSSLAEIDIAAQRLGAARKRYEAYLQLEPRSSQAMVALAVLTRRSGAARDEASKWIDKALAASPNDSRIWRQAIEFHQRDGDNLAALSLAQKANAVIPDNAEVLRLLASAQLAAGDKRQAISALEDVVRLQPTSVDAHIILGLTQLSLGNVTAARSAIDSAAKLAPEWPPVLRARVTLALAGDKDLAKARAIAAKQQTANPKQALGWQLEGEIESGQHNWPAAIAAFQQAMAKGSSSTIAKQLHDAMMRAEQQDEAAALAQRWLASHPSDLEFLTYLAHRAMKQKDFAAASEHLRAALKVRPNDAVLLNNLAMTELELQHPDALETAQRAVKLAPHHPAILDTLAQALSTYSTLDKAIETQALAVELAPQSSTLRLRLARYYIEANRKQEAREQLRLLTHSGTPRADRDAAEKLLAQLPG